MNTKKSTNTVKSISKNILKNKVDNKGITLISLVITIVIMLILTGITINLLFGENGIITKTKMAKKAFLGEDVRQVVEDRVNAYIAEYGSKGDLSLFDFWAMYNSSELLDASGNGTGQANPNYDPNFVIYLFEEEAAVGFTPTIQAYDRNTQYTSAVVIYKGYQATVNKNLTVAKKVTAVDELTETQISKLENKQVYTITPTGWTNGNVTITPGAVQGSTFYYTETKNGVMQEWTEDIIATENKTYYYEVRSGGTTTDEGEIEAKVDKVAPTIGTLTGTLDGANVNLSIGVTDTLSGYSKVEFYHRLSGGEYVGPTTVVGTAMNAQVAGEIEETTVNATLNSLSTGTYDIYAIVYDVAGNSATSETIQIEITLPYTWSELSTLAKEISNDSSITWNGTETVTKTVGTKEYTVSVGDKATVYYDNTAYTVKILGFNHDELADPEEYGTGNESTKAGISFEFEKIVERARMNPADTTSGGWNSTEMKTKLNSTSETGRLNLNTLQQTLNGAKMYSTTQPMSIIKTVKKQYMASYNATGLSTTTNDNLWLLSCGEIWSDGKTDFSGYNANVHNPKGYAMICEGRQYKYYAIKTNGISYNSANSDIKKYLLNSISSGSSWLRSPSCDGNKYFCCFGGHGGCSYNEASYVNCGVSPGFAI